jgi:hypothetical protein
MKKIKYRKAKISDLSPEALRDFIEIQRIANKAVHKAIEENKRFGIKESDSQK